MSADAVAIELTNTSLRTWEQLRRDARTVETRLQPLIVEYGQLHGSAKQIDIGSDGEQAVANFKARLRQKEHEINQLLEE
ncbi:hypothetical protein EV182_002617, partial [Spiromyces aspiralis]